LSVTDILHVTLFSATKYQIKFSENRSLLREDFNSADNVTQDQVTSGDLSSPEEPGNIEEIEIQLQNVDFSKPLYFALKVIDDVGKESDVSNIATVPQYVPPPVETTPEPSTMPQLLL
jgi:hypothetical protein